MLAEIVGAAEVASGDSCIPNFPRMLHTGRT